jgi:hypothetical protein
MTQPDTLTVNRSVVQFTSERRSGNDRSLQGPGDHIAAVADSLEEWALWETGDPLRGANALAVHGSGVSGTKVQPLTDGCGCSGSKF